MPTQFSPYMFTPEMLADPMSGAAAEAMGSQILMGPGGSQSYDRFKQVYQRRTGDVTGDPFLGLGDRNVARAYNQAAADDYTRRRAAMLGLSVTEQRGTPAINPPVSLAGPNPATAAVAARSAPAVATMQPDPVAAANETAYYMRNPDRAGQALMQNPAVAEVTKSLGVVQPFPDAAAAVLARTGQMPMPRSYVAQLDTDPESPNYGLDAHVLNNPKFQQLQKLDPSLAAKTYEQLTGVSLDAASKTVAARRSDREKLDDMMVSRLANDITVDPKTGQFAKRVRVQKKPGYMDRFNMDSTVPEYEDQYVPLNPVEEKWLRSGAFERKTGINIRDMLAQRNPPGPASTDPKYVAAYSEALKRTGNPELAALSAKRGTAGPAYMENPMNPEFMRQENMSPWMGALSPIFGARVAAEQMGTLLGRF